MITDVRTESPYWLMLNGYVTPYFALESDAKADVVVIGGGISGALAARALAAKGADVILVDRRHVALLRLGLAGGQDQRDEGDDRNCEDRSTG